jgi:putative colanic acid biosynthesis UDP-glucose lipid carrier transferase
MSQSEQVSDACPRADRGGAYSAKRLFDLTAVLCLLPILLPVMMAIFVLVRLERTGPAFFMQSREGKGGKLFVIYKFRSMVASKLDGESRPTRTGAFLRRTHLDEIPQIINVLKGDMSFVGPRPHTRSDNDDFEARLPGFRDRLAVRPGITGLAQAKGFYGQIKTDEDLVGRFRNDMAYIHDHSVLLDIKIIFVTARDAAKILLRGA